MESELIKSLVYDTKYIVNVDFANITFTIKENIIPDVKGIYVKHGVKGINNNKIVVCYTVVEEEIVMGLGTGIVPDRRHLAEFFNVIGYVKQRTLKMKSGIEARHNVTYLVEVRLPSYYQNPWRLWRRIGRSGRWCNEFWSTIRKKTIHNPICEEFNDSTYELSKEFDDYDDDYDDPNYEE